MRAVFTIRVRLHCENGSCLESTLISIEGYHQRCENGYLPETIRVSLHCENGSCLESTLISVKGY